MALGIIETILHQQEEIKSLLNQLLSGGAEVATKKKGKKAEPVQAEDTPTLPGGLVITEVDVQPVPTAVNIPVQQAPPTQATPPAQVAPAENAALVGSTIKTQLDMMAPGNPPLRAMLGQFSGEWLTQNGLSQGQVTMELVPVLIAYCQDRLSAHLQQAQQPVTAGGY
jgi:hypothetical protein